MKKLPDGWKILKLAEVTECLDSKRVPLNSEQRSKITGKIPYYGANGKLDSINQFIFDEELLLLAEDGGLWGAKEKCAYIIKGKSWVNNHAHVLRMKESINKVYLMYFLNYFDLNKYITGTTRGKLNRNSMDNINVILPPFPTQKKIAAILEKAEKLREWRKEADELTDELLKSTFLEMFGDPIKNPRNWEFVKFGKVGSLQRGKSKHRPRDAPELLGGPYPLIQTGDVANSEGYIKEYHQTYSELGLSQSKMWSAGTLCITIAANIAKTGILTFDACFPDSIVGFTPNKSVKTEYVKFWLSFLQKKLEETAPESAQKNINLQILSKLNIPLPPIELQNKFAIIVGQVEQLRDYQIQSRQYINNFFNVLIQEAFNGDLL